MQLVVQIYNVASGMPVEERYGLAQQLKRAAVSVPSNIAEGHARGATRDFCRFISIARGSVAEVETQIELAVRVGLVQSVHAEPIIQKCDKLGRILRGLRKLLDNKLGRT